MDPGKLWSTLREVGVPQSLTVLSGNLDCGQEATVGTEYRETERFPVAKSVRQVHFYLSLYLICMQNV